MLKNLFSKPLKPADLARLPKVVACRKAGQVTASAVIPPNPEPPPQLSNPLRRVALVGTHVCPACGQETEVTCGMFVEHTGLRQTAERTRILKQADWDAWRGLPFAIEETSPEPRICPRCIGHIPQHNPAQLAFSF